MVKKKQIEIGGKKYTLTVKRSMLITLKKVAPELLKINGNSSKLSEKEIADLQYEAGLSIYDNMDVIFYEVIRVAHPTITKEKSDEIYSQFRDEQLDVEEKLMEFFSTTFTDGIPVENKKKIDWQIPVK